MEKDVSLQSHKTENGRVARRRAKVRAQLLEAARQVFLERGYQDATISEVTELADVAMGTFYLHFRDKEDLFSALTQDAFKQGKEHIATILTQHPEEPILPLVIRAFFHYAYERRELFALVCAGGGNTHTTTVQECLAHFLFPLLQIVRDQENGSSYNPLLFAHLVVAMIVQGVNWWFEHDEPGPEAMADHILHILSQGLPSELYASEMKNFHLF